MESSFAYDKVAVGSDFISRKKELDIFVKTIIESSKGVSICGAPKIGKESLVQKGLSILKTRKYDYILIEMDLFKIRSYKQFINEFGRIMLAYLQEFEKYAIIPFDVQLEKLTDITILNLPENVAEKAGKTLIIYFKEFQNILSWEGGSTIITHLEKQWMKLHKTKFIISGSFVNSMKYIFEEKKYFYYLTENIMLDKLNERECCDYIYTGFINSGRVIEQEQAKSIYEIVDGNPWYLKHFCSICLSMPIGYVNQNVVLQGRDSLLSIHIPRFKQIMMDLTDNQINFLKAVLDEVPRFSSSDILEKYKLNSSANVFRLKDALKKKEVVTFNKDDNASIVDPLFKYWLNNYYFKQI
ncbi:MAG: hypothetical protein PHD11_08870 [Bacteroidales bacterium]|nr:hypothetical protein [Bacteroidales bacterium]MDD4670820.1 hypothetical protein [Bacteroidales bacterium]